MLLIIAIGLTVVFTIIRPYYIGLLNTGKWLVRIRTSKDTKEDGETAVEMATKLVDIQGLNFVIIPVFNSLIFSGALVLSSIYRWWGFIVVLAIVMLLRKATVNFFTPSLAYYLKGFHRRIIHEIKDINDSDIQDRLSEYESYLTTLEEVIPIYKDSRLKPPNRLVLKEIPFGDINYLIENYYLEK